MKANNTTHNQVKFTIKCFHEVHCHPGVCLCLVSDIKITDSLFIRKIYSDWCIWRVVHFIHKLNSGCRTISYVSLLVLWNVGMFGMSFGISQTFSNPKKPLTLIIEWFVIIGLIYFFSKFHISHFTRDHLMKCSGHWSSVCFVITDHLRKCFRKF